MFIVLFFNKIINYQILYVMKFKIKSYKERVIKISPFSQFMYYTVGTPVIIIRNRFNLSNIE